MTITKMTCTEMNDGKSYGLTICVSNGEKEKYFSSAIDKQAPTWKLTDMLKTIAEAIEEEMGIES